MQPAQNRVQYQKDEFIEADFIAYNDRRGTGELIYQLTETPLTMIPTSSDKV
jgi:hypothetical protein